jgi:hypothetical protein
VNRDLVLAGLVLNVCGSLTWLGGLLFWRGEPFPTGGVALERRLWRRLWMPLWPALGALALLLGWALQEPAQTDELLRPLALGLAAPLGLIWARAAWRAVRALRLRAPKLPAAAVGLLRPRVVLDPEFERALDPAAREAVMAHERAHVRHRDPLRIWLAQLVTDLQWPLGGARARLDEWMNALELARDDEARRAGVAGEDLAGAVIAAARMAVPGAAGASAALTSAGRALDARVRRLLAPLDAEAAPAASRRWALALALALGTTLALAALAGFTYGDLALRALPIVTT